ncbi:hypothetical protein, partial [Neomicrococcus lactis]
PPAFILSQDQTLRKKIQTPPTQHGKTRYTMAPNSNPAIKNPTTNNHKSSHSPSGSYYRYKTIGINKHDTLLRSQTTDTYQTSIENHFSISALAT